MATPAKLEANRRNARNAVKHGVFAHLPVVPGENPYDWDRHRAGILAALAPVGLLEVNLAERVALLLWQMARLGRCQAAAVTAAVEDAGLAPPDVDPVAVAFHAPGDREEDHLRAVGRGRGSAGP